MLLHESDQELIQRCQRGDQESFGILYDRYERAVYRFVYHVVGNADEADDIKQDT